MCVPACTRKIAADLSRSNFLKTAELGAGTLLTTGGCVMPIAQATNNQLGMAQSTVPGAPPSGVTFSRIVDLTHTLTPDFPTFGGEQQLEIESVFKLASDGYNLNIWHLNEHTGTHLDSPFHFSDGPSADQLAIERLVGPLAIIDIRAKAEADPDAQVTPDDIAAWEALYGPLPEGVIVAMLSGWDAHVKSDKFRNVDPDGVMHFPGFHIETAEMLITERNVKGVFVDTLSLDYGPSADFAFHYRWLPADHWGMECVANLGELPINGATVIVGAPKIARATGGPSRVIALV